MTREQFDNKMFDCKYKHSSIHEVIKAQSNAKSAYIKSIKSKLTIAREFIQSVRNDTPESVEWKELNKTLEAIK